MSNAVDRYFTAINSMLEDVRQCQADALETAARAVYQSLSQGGMLYLFGTGHAHMLAEELFYRAGGLARVWAVLDERLMLHISASESTQWERKSGLARELLEGTPAKQGDVILISSNSGRNAAPVEMALEARKRGMYVIAITCLRHSRLVDPVIGLDVKLYEVADLVLDTEGVPGDACVDIGGGIMMGATSTVVGAAIAQAVAARAGELAAQDGVPLEAFTSSNLPGGDRVNEALLVKYRGGIRGL